MTDSSSQKPVLAIEISPLIEHDYTGISNVVYEISKRLLDETEIPIYFLAGNIIVEKEVIRQCIFSRTGDDLKKFLSTKVHKIIDISTGEIDGRRVVALFTNAKPSKKVFYVESQIYYDLSPIVVPECHTLETVQYHTNGLIQQIDTCDEIFCISESTASDIKNLFCVDSSKLHVFPLGSTVDHIQLAKTRKYIEDSFEKVEPYFLILGTIEPRKNLAFLLSWIGQNIHIAFDYKFVFVGREGWGPSFGELINEAGLNELYQSGRICWYGYVDEKIKASLLAGASGLIYPSIFEGFGLPVLEAMSSSVLVLSSSATSMPEILGNCGYYFNPESLESLNDAYLQFERDKSNGDHSKMRKAALTRSEIFSYDVAYDQIMSILKKRIES